jgi:hypothetical protein
MRSICLRTSVRLPKGFGNWRSSGRLAIFGYGVPSSSVSLTVRNVCRPLPGAELADMRAEALTVATVPRAPSRQGNVAVRRLANTVTFCDGHGVFFVAASGQFRTPANRRPRAGPKASCRSVGEWGRKTSTGLPWLHAGRRHVPRPPVNGSQQALRRLQNARRGESGAGGRSGIESQRPTGGGRHREAVGKRFKCRCRARLPLARSPLAEPPLGDTGQLRDHALGDPVPLEQGDDRAEITLGACVKNVLSRAGSFNDPAHLGDSQSHGVLPVPLGCSPSIAVTCLILPVIR